MAFPVHARFAHPDAGWPGDQKEAAERLTPGEVYTVLRVDVGRSSSRISFYEVPDADFNSVMFDAAEIGDA